MYNLFKTQNNTKQISNLVFVCFHIKYTLLKYSFRPAKIVHHCLEIFCALVYHVQFSYATYVL